MYAIRSYYAAINTYMGENDPDDYVRMVRTDLMGIVREDLIFDLGRHRITSYNVCYTKLLRLSVLSLSKPLTAPSQDAGGSHLPRAVAAVRRCYLSPLSRREAWESGAAVHFLGSYNFV